MGACEQRQVKGTEPREGTRGCEHSALPTAARCVTLKLQRGRTSARLASLPARQASPTVPWLPFRVPGWRRWKGQELGQTGSS